MLGIVSYGIAMLSYGVAGVIVATGPGGKGRFALLAVAVFASSTWAGGMMLSLLGGALPPGLVFGLDALHLFVWTASILVWLTAPSARKLLLGAAATAGIFAVVASWPGASGALIDGGSYIGLVLLAIVCFLAVEQVYRNAEEHARRRLKPLCIAILSIAGVDLFVYSNAALLGAPEPAFWEARGLVNLIALLPIMMTVRRQSSRRQQLHVSRHVVFYTASLLGISSYLLAMGLVAYIIRAVGSEWSFPVEIAFLAIGTSVLLVAMFSSSIRARFKVSVLKHFFRSKYDYRQEWLSLTQTLSRTGDLQESAVSGLKGMARIINSQKGDLYLERDGHRYDWLCSLDNEPAARLHYDRNHPLVAFLAASSWVVDSEEYTAEPTRYGRAFGRPDGVLLPKGSIVVPLEQQGHLQGFVVLAKPPGLGALNFDDHDILKTAGRQVAAVLAQALAQEKLAETRQFEAMNRLTAFLMHDLKNVVAQQSLVVSNAERFRNRADFIDDAFTTIKAGTDRIRRVLEELSAATRQRPAPGRVDVSKVLMEVRSHCADRMPVPEIALDIQPAWVRMDREELTSAILHLVRNAQDATPADGCVSLGLSKADSRIVITVTDTGCGMDSAFVRDRLFRPFDSTKGASGMGIGAHQARHIVRRAGGELDVTTKVGAGTTFRIELPASE